MPNAGYCHDCQAYVWLTPDWACPKGHSAARVNAWYDSDTGAKLAPPAATPPVVAAAPAPVAPMAVAPAPPAGQPAPAAAAQPAAGTRDAFLRDLMSTMAQYPDYAVAWGTDTDMTISSNVVDANVVTAKKKVDYEAVLKAVEAEHVVYLWEILKEKGSGFSMGGFESETTTFSGKRWGTTKEVIVGAGGVASYEWDYGKTRAIIENVAARHGFTVKVVLNRKKAIW
jgi:hypothetical protein